jgi:hypothetical protein
MYGTPLSDERVIRAAETPAASASRIACPGRTASGKPPFGPLRGGHTDTSPGERQRYGLLPQERISTHMRRHQPIGRDPFPALHLLQRDHPSGMISDVRVEDRRLAREPPAGPGRVGEAAEFVERIAGSQQLDNCHLDPDNSWHVRDVRLHLASQRGRGIFPAPV